MTTTALLVLGLGLTAQPLHIENVELQTFIQLAEAAQSGVSTPQTIVELYVLRDGTPLSNVEVQVNGESFGRTDDGGFLLQRIPSGRADFTLFENGEQVLDLDLLTDAGEVVRVIVALQPDGSKPDVIIENTGRSSVLAGEREPTEPEVEGPKDAQPPGALVGTITSEEDEEPIAGARLFFSGTEVKTETDEDGKFQVELPAGTYSISVIHPDYATQTIDNIRVIPAKEVTLSLTLAPAGVQLTEYVVTAPYIEGSVGAAIEQQREATGVSDILGAEQIAATGDSNAAEALTRVTGLTVEDGRFVLVRGQPQRFTQILFNGSPLPSPEPLFRVTPLDLFPTGVLSNIEVQKSYTPDVPGAFGAGLVKLNTRGVPDEGFAEVSVGTGYNSESTFLDGLTYQGGSYDFFGVDDGTRAIPPEVVEATMDGQLELGSLPDGGIEVGRTFPNILNPESTTLPPDLKLSLTGGGGVSIFGDGRLGFIATGSFDNEWRRQIREQNFFAIGSRGLIIQDETIENRTDNNIELSGLLTLAAEWERHQISSNTFVVNSTQQRTQITTGPQQASDGVFNTEEFLLSWIERFLLVQQVIGHHEFDLISNDVLGWEIDWRGLVSRATRDAPDRRTYAYQSEVGIEPPEFQIQNQGGLTRNYSFVEDTLFSFGASMAFPMFYAEENLLRIKPSFGGDGEFLDRVAGAQEFFWSPIANVADPFNQNAEELFDPLETGITLNILDNSVIGADDYDGVSDIWGVFGQVDMTLKDPIGGTGRDVVRVVGGARYEEAFFETAAVSSTQPEVPPDITGFEEGNVLGSASATWFALEQLQVRAAYGRSLSRPVLNEIVAANFFDPDQGQVFLGNPDLIPTVIDGYDVRLEWYPSTTEVVSVGVFLKDYTNPIERVFSFDSGGQDIATFQNVDASTVIGVEFGGRFEFGNFVDWFGWPSIFENIYASGNAAILDSEVTIPEEDAAQVTSLERRLAGQAQYIVNFQLGLNTEMHDVTVTFNAIGDRLQRVGVLGQPDIFQVPIQRLDVSWQWRIWENGRLRLTGENLTNAQVRLTQQTDQDPEPVTFRAFRVGPTVALSFTWTFL
ncbi:MAG: TonB-dependent receptor domain-containing protein [Myxococcota bacterium]